MCSLIGLGGGIDKPGKIFKFSIPAPTSQKIHILHLTLNEYVENLKLIQGVGKKKQNKRKKEKKKEREKKKKKKNKDKNI